MWMGSVHHGDVILKEGAGLLESFVQMRHVFEPVILIVVVEIVRHEKDKI